MPLTRAERRQLEALQAKAAEDDAPKPKRRRQSADASNGHDEGGVYVLTGSHARSFVTSFFSQEEAEAFDGPDPDTDTDDDEDQDDDDQDDDEDDEAEPDPPTRHGHKFFGG